MRAAAPRTDAPASVDAGGRRRRAPRGRRWSLLALVLAVLVGIAWALRTPPLERIPHFAERPVSNIAHAGASGHAPQNTLSAFELALEMGADTLEMDLQLSADGEVVVFHDATVDALTDGSGAVVDLTLEQLKALDAGHAFPGPDGDFPYRGRGVTIPTLDEVFEAFPDTFMIVELKTDSGPGIVAAVADRIRAHGREDLVLVASFSLDYLRQFRMEAPEVPTNLAEGEVRSFFRLHLVGAHRWYRPAGHVFQVPEYSDGTHVVTGRFLRAADALNLDVHVWTVNEPEDMRRLVDLGVDALITDYPDRLAEILDEG